MRGENSMTPEEFFREHPKAAVAFSGGTDSSYLLYTASLYAEEVKAYYVKTAFQPAFELADAERFCREIRVPLRIIEKDILSVPEVVPNPADRCYYCKQSIFSAIRQAAAEDGFSVLLDGTNASDDVSDRPGMRALQELSVLSPLRICGLGKDQIRLLSKEAGLFTWDKPAYACLATRIPAGEEITAEKLAATEASETFLSGLGFSDFRVRRRGNAALLQVREEDLDLVLDTREEILEKLKSFYSSVMLDLEVRE